MLRNNSSSMSSFTIYNRIEKKSLNNYEETVFEQVFLLTVKLRKLSS